MEEIKTDQEQIIYAGAAAYMPGVKAAVTFSTNQFDFEENIMPEEIGGKKRFSMILWGEENTYPAEVVELVESNPVASPLLDFKVDLAYGSGLRIGYTNEDGEFVPFTKKEIKEKAALKEVDDWFKDNNINSQLTEIFTDLAWFQQSNIEFILTKDHKKIAEINSKETTFSRWSEMNDKGKVEWHLYSAKWGQHPEEKDFSATKALDFKKPRLDLLRRMGLKPLLDGKTKADKDVKYIYPIRFATPGRPYYPSPYWHSIVKSGWLEFANKIPEFKKTMMVNSVVVKYHVEISQAYFPRIFADEGITDKKEMIARINKEYESIQDFLTGSKNTGKPIISYFKMTPDGKVIEPDIKITVVDSKIGGEYLEDSQEASSMIYTALRTHPSLVGVIPGKNSSSLSGSDKRELLRIAQTFQVRTRDKVFEVLDLVREINGWDSEIEFAINDIILTTLDQGKEVQEIETKA